MKKDVLAGWGRHLVGAGGGAMLGAAVATGKPWWIDVLTALIPLFSAWLSKRHKDTLPDVARPK